MKYWLLQQVFHESDYRDSYINGSLEHPFGLPGVRCDACNQTWASTRVLPYTCPERFRKHPNVAVAGTIPRIEHVKLQEDLMDEIGIQGEPFRDLHPGDDFQPCYLDVPSRPRADFLWCSLGSLVVSEKIKNALIRSWSDEVAICPVNLRKIGNRDAKLEPPMPATGEPEDIINEVPLLEDKSSIGPYYEVIVLNASGYPRGVTPITVCQACGREEINNKKRWLMMFDEMWKGHSIFLLSTTLYVVVTDPLKEVLAEMNPTNVAFTET